jgi:hypothetical protein
MQADAHDTITLWIQAAAVVVAVVSSLLALYLAHSGRRDAERLARENQQASLRHAKLLLDVENLRALLELENRGGSTDPEESARMGADALTLTGLIGPERLPELWARRVGGDDSKLRELAAQDGYEEWKKDAVLVQIALNGVLRDIARETGQDAHGA